LAKVVATADGQVSATDRKTGTLKREQEIHQEEVFDLDAGDGNTKVVNTRGFKKWASDRDKGLTVEATVSVSLTCNQDKKTIKLATRMAGAMAERFAREGLVQMNEYFSED